MEEKLNAEKIDAMVIQLNRISGIIQQGAKDFLFAEYKYMAVYIVIFAGILVGLVSVPTSVAFVVGAVTSIVCGWIGMMIAVRTNVKCSHQSWMSLQEGFEVAMQGGCDMGLSLVSLGVLALLGLIFAFTKWGFAGDDQKAMYEAIAGYGLGGSSIALFGRVGGGIYTKAADVGADLSGKNEYGLEEDDYRNPGCIADNVGDNVGDIAGMGADLFGSFAESTCAALVLAAANPELNKNFASLMYPILVSSAGIFVGLLTLFARSLFFSVKGGKAGQEVDPDATVEKALKGVLIISTVLMTPCAIALSNYCLPATYSDGGREVQWTYCAVSICLGLWSGLIIGVVTEYYTSHSYEPVRSIARTQKRSAATGIILGLALGYLSCIVPTFCLGITILVAHTLCGFFGVALAALGMLGTLTMGLTIDAYGPISDNAGGIAEMSQLPEYVRERTDCLDAAGNTTAAIGKGFAIGSAALVSLALFGAYCTRADVQEVDILDPWVFTGLLLGAMMPYAFAAWTMKSVGDAAQALFDECMRQFPHIMSTNKTDKDVKDPKTGKMMPPYAEPDYTTCIMLATDASLREMLAPGALVILTPLIAGLGFGKNACAGMLSGALVSSVQLAISMSNTGGAWDNSKKWISAGGLGEQDRKGSETHANSVTGDTVGDPLKDTSGPALNIVMKLTAIISLVFGTAIANQSNASGGPKWLQ
jgi:inorganic pyrophosphatase